MHDFHLPVFFFIFGLLVGSFLNVLIYRLPRDLNIVFPRSSCPHCKKLIYWYENIPVISYIFLRGKCSECQGCISIKYPLVELFTGIISLFVFYRFFYGYSVLGGIVDYAFYFTMLSVFLVHFLIDLEFKILPNSLNIYLLLIFLIRMAFFSSWTFWLVGGLIGLLFPLIVTWLFYLVRGQIGLGGGDIKLFGILGIFLGPVGIFQNIFLSCMLGSIVGLTLIFLKKMDKNNPIPFGPFILLVAAVQVFFPEISLNLLGFPSH